MIELRQYYPYGHCVKHLFYSSKDGKNFEDLLESGKGDYYTARIDFSDKERSQEDQQREYDKQVKALRDLWTTPLRSRDVITIKQQQENGTCI